MPSASAGTGAPDAPAHPGDHSASAWARRVTSVCRSSRRACTGVPGSESSARNSQSKASSSLNPPSLSTVNRPGRCLRISPSCRKSAGILPLPLPGTAMSLRSRSSWRTRLGDVPRSWAASAGVSVSIGCEPMASVRPADSPVPGQGGQEPPPLDLDRLEADARARLPAPVYDYYAGGAEAETTLAEATGAWRGWRLRPRVLRGVSEVRLSTELLGSPVGTPIGVAPWAAQTLAHPDGELGTARGAAAAGALMTVSTSATHTLEEVAAELGASPGWFQLYRLHSPGYTDDLARRAGDAGYRALVLTVDLPLLGRRRRDLRHDFALPAGLRMAHHPPVDGDQPPEATPPWT